MWLPTDSKVRDIRRTRVWCVWFRSDSRWCSVIYCWLLQISNRFQLHRHTRLLHPWQRIFSTPRIRPDWVSTQIRVSSEWRIWPSSKNSWEFYVPSLINGGNNQKMAFNLLLRLSHLIAVDWGSFNSNNIVCPFSEFFSGFLNDILFVWSVFGFFKSILPDWQSTEGYELGGSRLYILSSATLLSPFGEWDALRISSWDKRGGGTVKGKMCLFNWLITFSSWCHHLQPQPMTSRTFLTGRRIWRTYGCSWIEASTTSWLTLRRGCPSKGIRVYTRPSTTIAHRAKHMEGQKAIAVSFARRMMLILSNRSPQLALILLDPISTANSANILLCILKECLKCVSASSRQLWLTKNAWSRKLKLCKRLTSCGTTPQNGIITLEVLIISTVYSHFSIDTGWSASGMREGRACIRCTRWPSLLPKTIQHFNNIAACPVTMENSFLHAHTKWQRETGWCCTSSNHTAKGWRGRRSGSDQAGCGFIRITWPW